MLFKISEVSLHDNGTYFMYLPRDQKPGEFIFMDFENGSSPLQMHNVESIEPERLRAYEDNSRNVLCNFLFH